MVCVVIIGFAFYWRFFFCKQKTAYEMSISDWSSDVCSSDLCAGARVKNPLFASWIWSIPFLCLQKYLAGAQWRRLSGILSHSGAALGRPRFSPDGVRFERRGAIFRIIATETCGR